MPKNEAIEIQTSEFQDKTMIKFKGIELEEGSFNKTWDESGGFLLRDSSSGQLIYREDYTGFWTKWEYDSECRETLCARSDGYFSKREYDSEGRKTRHEFSGGSWRKTEFDSMGREIYSESSRGRIECTREWLDKNYVKKGEEQNAKK